MSEKEDFYIDSVLKKDPQRKFAMRGGKRVYDPDELLALKRSGLPKPADCTWAQWNGPKQGLTERMKWMAYLRVNGATNENIAREVGISLSRVSIISSSPRFKEYVSYLRYKIFGEDTEDRLKKLAPLSVDVITETLKSSIEKGSVKADVAFRLLDRVYGKPQQKIEHTGSGIRELIERIDRSGREANVIEAEYRDAKASLDKSDPAVVEFIKTLPGVVSEEEEKDSS
jgi:hypothetical protein